MNGGAARKARRPHKCGSENGNTPGSHYPRLPGKDNKRRDED
ncbi:hypothetical protein SAMN04488020_103215 [Palleronia marisminoris]|nr:hypothetical protein SAMN04488020_103215 [Palleronia marisminoris]